MGKRFSVIVTALTLLFLSGCGVGNEVREGDIKESYDGSIEVNSGGKEYKCEYLHTSEKSNIIKIVEPESLRGLTFLWEDDRYNVSWKDLSCEFNRSFLPDTSFLSDIVCIMNSVHEKDLLKYVPDDSEDNVYMGSNETGNFKIVFDKSGNLKQINVDDKNIQVKTQYNA